MHKTITAAAFCLLLLAGQAFALNFKTTGNELQLDTPAGWKAVEKDDPDTILFLESGKKTMSFVRRDDELSDRYLKLRLEDALDGARAAGARPDGNIRVFTIHDDASFYYTVYDAGADTYTLGIFTYGEKSYNFEGKNINTEQLELLAWSIRKPGEALKERKVHIEEPAPAPEARPRRTRRAKPAAVAAADIVPETTPQADPAAVTATHTFTAAVPAATGTQFWTPAPANETAGNTQTETAGAMRFVAEEEAKRFFGIAPKPEGYNPLLKRKPLPKILVLEILGGWAALALVFFLLIRKPDYPKIDLTNGPQGWAFPVTVDEGLVNDSPNYHMISRTGQILDARLERHGQKLMATGVYGILALYALVSFTCDTLPFKMALRILVHLPFNIGEYFLLVPELPFALMFVTGLVKRITSSGDLHVYNRTDDCLMQTKPIDDAIVFTDGDGIVQLGRLYRSKESGRDWQFVTPTGEEAFSLAKDNGGTHFLRKFFGHLGGKLRARYTIYINNEKAGFISVNPARDGSFQYFCDPAYPLIAQPLQVVSVLAYTQAQDGDVPYPWL